MTTIALMGAGGKVGFRIAKNLKDHLDGYDIAFGEDIERNENDDA